MLKLNFIGRVTTLASSFIAMLLAANSSNTSAKGQLNLLPPGKLSEMHKYLQQTHKHAAQGHNSSFEVLGKRLRERRSEELDAAVAKSYAQDLACFGGGASGKQAAS